nr:receptor-like protein 12 [Quercus suber]
METALTHAVPCMDSGQEALLKIKEGFIKSSDPFSSWRAEKDCCKWKGVGCDNTNGHVTILYLRSQDLFNLLQVLDLGGVDLTNAENWLDTVNLLLNLVELRLFFCKLHKLPLNLPHVNFTSPKIPDLSHNEFSSTIPEWLFDIGHSLVHLNLSRCQLQALIPDAIGNLTSLTSLDLSMNNLEGPIPLTLGLFQKESKRLTVLHH